MSAIQEVIDAFNEAPTTVERGTKFEELMVDYFTLDPVLSSQYDQVMRWTDWPHRQGSADVGIDLVAREKSTGGWSAIQCKFYAPNHVLQKKDIDSFFTASGKRWDGVRFTNRIIISTTDKWSRHAESALVDQSIPVQRIGLQELDAAPVDWTLRNRLKVEVDLTRSTKYSPRPHQTTAISSILEGFRQHDQGQWISACGTGKTFTSLKLAEAMATNRGVSLCSLSSCEGHR